MVETETCSFEDCGLDAERNVEGVGPLCPGHRKQLQRGYPLTPLIPKSPRQRLEWLVERVLDASRALADREAQLEAEVIERGVAYANADCEDDRDWRAKRRELIDAARALGVTEVRSRRRR